MTLEQIEVGKIYKHRLTGEQVLVIEKMGDLITYPIKCRMTSYLLVDFKAIELNKYEKSNSLNKVTYVANPEA